MFSELDRWFIGKSILCHHITCNHPLNHTFGVWHDHLLNAIVCAEWNWGISYWKEIIMNLEDKKYQIAKRKVQGIKRFYIHLTTYLLVNVLLFLINITTSPNHLWFYWPLFGWGIGIVVNAVYVFGFGYWLGSDWEEKKIKEIVNEWSSRWTCKGRQRSGGLSIWSLPGEQ